MPQPLSTREGLSALADDALEGQALAALLNACREDEAALGCWNTYQLIGETLRAPVSGRVPVALDAELNFVSRLSQRLAQETMAPPLAQVAPAIAQPLQSARLPHAAFSHDAVPADAVLRHAALPSAPLTYAALPLTPPHAAPALAPLPLAAELARHRAEAANDSNFRWKLLAGVASLAAVSAIAWSASGLLAPPLGGPQLAQASPAPLLVASPAGAMVRDARLEELLAAHKQFGARSALQEPSGFLRNATFDMPQAAVAGR